MKDRRYVLTHDEIGMLIACSAVASQGHKEVEQDGQEFLAQHKFPTCRIEYDSRFVSSMSEKWYAPCSKCGFNDVPIFAFEDSTHTMRWGTEYKYCPNCGSEIIDG